MYYAIWKRDGVYAPAAAGVKIEEFPTRKSRDAWVQAANAVGDGIRRAFAAPKENTQVRAYLAGREKMPLAQLTL